MTSAGGGRGRGGLGRGPEVTRADLPSELTPQTLKDLPIGLLRRLARPDNGILDAEEQKAFDSAVHEMMSRTADRVSRQMATPDLEQALRGVRRGGPGRPRRDEETMRRIARRIGAHVDVAEELAPGVDWSFAQQDDQEPPAEDPAADSQTVADLEEHLSDQVELVQVMTEIAEISRRTYALEQQRDLSNTRSVFFGFVVSVAVIVAGWAPLVAADDWTERGWVVGLTLATCVLAGLVYMLTRRWQTSRRADPEEAAEGEPTE